MLKLALLCLAFSASAFATVYFDEKFTDGWEDRWVQAKRDGLGKFDAKVPKYYNDANDKGLHATQDAKFYAISGKFDDFSNKGKDLIIQFLVKHEQDIDCGGGYVKLYPADVDQEGLHGETPYNIMFGPDICGYGTRKVHVIFNYDGKNHDNKKSISCKADVDSHLYTLIVRPDQTYEVRIDGEKAESGSLTEDWDFLPPKQIPDPSVSKPEDWVDEKEIDDPEDKKPEDWDKPQYIADPDAEKPEDWDDEMDGEWEPPMIENPEYKGEWKPRRIPNPEYKGEWEYPLIDNPDYKEDNEIYAYDSIGAIGFDLWQVKSGSIFDDVLITDDLSEAEAAVEAFKKKAEGEKAMREAEEQKKKEAEEAAKKAAEQEDDDEEEIDDEDDDEAPAKDEL